VRTYILSTTSATVFASGRAVGYRHGGSSSNLSISSPRIDDGAESSGETEAAVSLDRRGSESSSAANSHHAHVAERCGRSAADSSDSGHRRSELAAKESPNHRGGGTEDVPDVAWPTRYIPICNRQPCRRGRENEAIGGVKPTRVPMRIRSRPRR